MHKSKLQRKSDNDNISRPVPASRSLKVVGSTDNSPYDPLALTITTLRKDQKGNDYVHIKQKDTGKEAVANYDLLYEAPQTFFKVLKNQGMRFLLQPVRTALIKKIDEAQESRRAIYVATGLGFHEGVFITPDHRCIGEPPRHFYFQPDRLPIPLAKAGTYEGWCDLVRLHVQGQATLIFDLCLAFEGPLCALTQAEDNLSVESVGTTSLGKSTGLSLAASVWGAPLGMTGSIAKRLRTTEVAVENTMAERAGAFVALDEVNALSFESRKQAQLVGDLVMLLSGGVDKDRANCPARGRSNQSIMLTSNKGLAQQLVNHDRDNSDAAGVRMLTRPADAGTGYGVYNTLPAGFDDSKAAIKAFKAGLVAHHGHAAEPFLQKLMACDRDELCAKFQEYCDDFVERCRVQSGDNAGDRRTDLFGRVYGAGAIASDLGVVPLTRKDIGEAVLECYGRSVALAQSTARSAIDRVRAYVQTNRDQLVDLDTDQRPNLNDRKLDRHPGFLKTRRGHQVVMMRTAQWLRLFGNDASRMLAELHHSGRLQVTKDLQLQTRVRTNSAKDRVYAVVID